MAKLQDFLSYQRFRSALLELERLVILRSQLLEAYLDVSNVGKAILNKIEILTSSHVVFSKVDCLLDTERLGEIRIKIREGTMSLQDGIDANHHVLESHLQGGGVVDEIMKVKLGALVRACENESESDRVYLLERLADLARKISDSRIHSVIADKIQILTQSMFSALSPPVRAASTVSDDSVIILTPDDDDSIVTTEDEEENVLKDQVEVLQRSLGRARSENAALAKKIDLRDVQIGRLNAQVASFATDTADLIGEDKIKQCVAQEVKGLAAENSRLTTEVANVHKTLDQINTSLYPQRSPFKCPPPECDLQVIEEPVGWPGHFPARPAEKILPIKHDRSASRHPNVGGHATPMANRSREPAFKQPHSTNKPTKNYTQNHWPNIDIPMSSAWHLPKAANFEPWGERSVSTYDTLDD